MVSIGTIASIANGIGSIAGAFGGGGTDRKTTHRFMNIQHDMNKEMAQNSIRWRAEDAKAAGLHPLAALGANTASSSPVSVGNFDDGRSTADRLSSLGQGIGRAASTYQTREQRQKAEIADGLRLEKMKLENDLLRAQTTQVHRATTPDFPGSPTAIPGQGNAVIDMPLERTVPSGSYGSTEPAPVTDVGFTRTSTGGYAPAKSKDAVERYEDDFIGNIMWNMRNRIAPTFGQYSRGAPFKAPPGTRWFYHPIRQEYLLTRD